MLFLWVLCLHQTLGDLGEKIIEMMDTIWEMEGKETKEEEQQNTVAQYYITVQKIL